MTVKNFFKAQVGQVCSADDGADPGIAFGEIRYVFSLFHRIRVTERAVQMHRNHLLSRWQVSQKVTGKIVSIANLLVVADGIVRTILSVSQS